MPPWVVETGNNTRVCLPGCITVGITRVCLPRVYNRWCITRVCLPGCVIGVYTRVCLPGCVTGVYTEVCLPGCVTGVYIRVCLPGCVTGVYIRGMPPRVCITVYNQGMPPRVCITVYTQGVKGVPHGVYLSVVIPVSLLGLYSRIPCAKVLSVAGFLPLSHPFHCWLFTVSLLVLVLLPWVREACCEESLPPPMGEKHVAKNPFLLPVVIPVSLLVNNLSPCATVLSVAGL